MFEIVFYLDWAQQIETSATPTGEQLSLPKVLGDGFSTPSNQPAILLGIPGYI